MNVTRRDCLAATGSALLAASALAAPAEASNPNSKLGDTLYGHGLVWNRDLPGVAGDLKLSFDLRVNLETGVGFGTAHDPLHPDWGLHYDIHTIESQRRPRGETRYTMTGVVTEAVDQSKVGLPVVIMAETSGDTTAVAIKLGDLAFGGAGLVVIAVIAILIGLLLPAINR
jgi:hypothetical protein